MKKKRMLAWMLALVFALTAPQPSMTHEVHAESQENSGECTTHNPMEQAYDIPARCTEPGYTNAVMCYDCGKILSYDSIIPPTGHSYTTHKWEWIYATCTEEGELEWMCDNPGCGHTERLTLPPLGHAPVPCAEEPASCLRAGSTGGTRCSRCDKIVIEPEVVPALGHDFSRLYIQWGATCVRAAGYRNACSRKGCMAQSPVDNYIGNPHGIHRWHYVGTEPNGDHFTYVWSCSDCKKRFCTDNSNITPSVHYDLIYESKNPTCTEDGYKDRLICKYHCGQVLSPGITLPKTGHAFREMILEHPDCTNPGRAYKECYFGCGEETEEYELLPTGHSWYADYSSADCTDNGVWRCRTCGARDDTVEVEPRGHDWVTIHIVPANGCDQPGKEIQYCTRCGTRQDIITEATEGHNYVSSVTTAPTCTKTGVTTYTCSGCADSYTTLIPALGHDWGAWVTVREPAPTENGLKKRVCARCGAVETEILPAVSANFTVDTISNQTYTGFAITANVRVFSKADNSRLDEYEHYMVDYENNTAAGTATAIVTGIGRYHGTVRVNFNILTADIGGALVEAIPSVTCTGEAIAPDPVIRYGGRLLVNGTDYTLAYANNVNPGTATVTVTGKGGFTGSRTISFTILENNADFSVSAVPTQAWTGGALTPDITVLSAGGVSMKGESAQAGSVILTEGVDYTLDYSGSADVGFGTVTVTGIGNYSGTIQLIFRIECADLNGAAVADIGGAAYTGAAYTPDLSGKLALGGRTLVEGTDYVVEIRRNILVGTAEIDIIGIGNYSGTIRLYANITPADISGSGFTVDGIAGGTYTGVAHTPDVILKKDGEALAPGIDYTALYSNNISAGTATVTVTGIGNYGGTRTAAFTVTPADASGFDVAAIPDQPCTGGAVTPALTITFNGMTLVKNVDYTVLFSNNASAGTATVTITGKGNFAGTTTATFEIVTVPLAGITLSSTALSLQYKGTGKLTVTFNPANATNKKVTWRSDNEKVATVDANGNVTAKGTGTATITATSEDGGHKASCSVTVAYVWWQWLIKILLFGWIWY